jgi:lysine 2,3-aminomutase
MHQAEILDRVAINVRSHKLLKKLLRENPPLEEIMRNSRNETEARVGVRHWVMRLLEDRPAAVAFYEAEHPSREQFEALEWRDYAAIRLLDYIDNAGRTFPDLNLHDELAVSDPIRLIWLAVAHGTGGAKPAFFSDTLELFRQLTGRCEHHPPTREQVMDWMERYPSGLDPRIVRLREENRDRIIRTLIQHIEAGRIRSQKYTFPEGMSEEEKLEQMLEWWSDHRFHLNFAVRSPDLLNELLGYSLDPDTMKVLYEAEEKGIPFFVNPYYLSLLHVRVPYFAIGADLAIRYYVLYSQELVNEFGQIVAWEKEDKVEPGKPNAAGWLLPTSKNVHRRYPDVAILIPDTMGRACGGLCASCQRMYDFQSGHLNFDLERLKPQGSWSERLERIMEYFESSTHLRDILITGGDALMSSDRSLEEVLNAILAMAARKRSANAERADGEKYAELQRVRLGTRLPAYLPQRITPELEQILREFKRKGSELGISQFVIQTHFESPMEVTPAAREAVSRLLAAGWMVTNQHVLTSAASRRGHAAQLRRVLGDIGVLPYYTFTVKGYMENWFNFAPNARVVQEQVEEKVYGRVPEDLHDSLKNLHEHTERLEERLANLRSMAGVPFLATDRNVLNLPAVGKSLTFRVIGITRYGRRILEFDHDGGRDHSPVIEAMGKVVIVESKSVSEYLQQMEELGEDTSEYAGLYGYSVGVVEQRMPVFEYPALGYEITDRLNNLDLAGWERANEVA